MISRFKSILFAKSYSAILAVVLCFSVLGIQSVGLFHGVHHANSGQHLQSHSVFNEIEKAFSSDPQKSNSACKLLDSLLTSASAISQHIDFVFSRHSQIAFAPVVTTTLALSRVWSYQSQAPPTI